MKSFTSFTLYALAGIVLAGQLNAQCPAGGPLSMLAGTRWVYLTEENGQGAAFLGTFTASVQISQRNGQQIGVLSVTQTANSGGNIVKSMFAGGYSVNPDCLGGTLYLSTGGGSLEYNFYFTTGNTRMYMVVSNNTTENPYSGALYSGIRGVARQVATTSTCPAPPLSALSGRWSFLTQDYPGAAAGTFTASIAPASARRPGTGALTLTLTQSGYSGGVVKGTFQGGFDVNSDCSGGELSIDGNDVGMSYAYLFVDPNTIFMVSDNNNGPSVNGQVFRGNRGIATRD